MARVTRALLALACPILVSASDGDAFNFLVMGDWGGKGSPPYTTPEEIATAVFCLTRPVFVFHFIYCFDSFFLAGTKKCVMLCASEGRHGKSSR